MNEKDQGSVSDGLIQAAMEIAARRKQILLRLREALDRDDLAEAKRLIKELVPDHVHLPPPTLPPDLD